MSSNSSIHTDLPINAVLPEVLEALSRHDSVVLQAAPGAGKTTRVPLALIDQPWLHGQKILMLEPRRIAAKGAAEFMAQALEEKPGQRVGYRMRMESKVSDQTCIEVITEGVLIRMLQDDPSLEGIGLIIFDEFHERSLDADFGLALCQHARSMFRAQDSGELPLKILLMSATLEGLDLSAVLSDTDESAPLIKSEGRQYPVELLYLGGPARGESIIPAVKQAVIKALSENTGSVLVFLPGQAEIRKVVESLQDEVDAGTLLAPLFGDLSLAEQRRAILPAPKGQRKVVLATNIAESSLTIEGVSVVIDSGLARVPVFDLRTGMTRLHTRRISQASSEQRKGRAGRLGPGVCYRLWSESEQSQMERQSAPEIRYADFAPILLQCLSWGLDDPMELRWLEPPSDSQVAQAQQLLLSLGALEKNATGLKLTELGQSIAMMPAHPRIGAMLLRAKASNYEKLACQLAALLSERDPLSRDQAESLGADLDYRLSLFQSKSPSPNVKRLVRQSEQFMRLLRDVFEGSNVQTHLMPQTSALACLLASAYPDRIAKCRAENSERYLLSNGRAARLAPGDALRGRPYLVVATLGSRAGQSEEQIYLAAALDEKALEQELASLTHERTRAEWDEGKQRFVAERKYCLGQLVISSEPIERIDPEVRTAALVDMLVKKGLELLPWTHELEQLCARVEQLRQALHADGQVDEAKSWPDLGREALKESMAVWLAPFLSEVSRLEDLAKIDLKSALLSLLPWPKMQELDRLMPERIEVPSGSRLGIDYLESPPVLAVKLQEMFGCAETPSVAQGRLLLKIHLLSPARRPLAVTQDLKTFWANAYPDVKKDMKGRYPKHPWPDDPLSADATARTKNYKS